MTTPRRATPTDMCSGSQTIVVILGPPMKMNAAGICQTSAITVSQWSKRVPVLQSRRFEFRRLIAGPMLPGQKGG